MNSSVGGVTGGVIGGCGGGVVPQPTWTLALSESVPPSHVTVAVFVRPLFGDAFPFLHVQSSSYVVAHGPFLTSSRPRDSSIWPSSFTVAGTPTSVGVAQLMVAVALAEESEPHVAVAVLFATSVEGETLYEQFTVVLAGTVMFVLSPPPQSIRSRGPDASKNRGRGPLDIGPKVPRAHPVFCR